MYDITIPTLSLIVSMTLEIPFNTFMSFPFVYKLDQPNDLQFTHGTPIRSPCVIKVFKSIELA